MMTDQDVRTGIVMLCPGESLADQVSAWAERHPECRLDSSHPRSPPEVRRALRDASVALLDATDDPAGAADAFTQAVRQLGAYGVTVYTETMHEWLELFVRTGGSLLLFGPLSHRQWEDFFRRALRPFGRIPPSRLVVGQPGGQSAGALGAEFLEQVYGNRKPAGVRRPKTGVK